MKIIEVNKDIINNTLNSLLEEKDVEIQNWKKKLKMPHEAHVQIVEMKIVLQEKQILENELQNTKEVVGTIKDQKEMLENQVKLLKDKVDQLYLSNPNFSLVTEIGDVDCLLVRSGFSYTAQQQTP